VFYNRCSLLQIILTSASTQQTSTPVSSDSEAGTSTTNVQPNEVTKVIRSASIRAKNSYSIEHRLMDYVPAAFYGAVVVVSPDARAAS
jgi:hypothetical protein